MPMTKHQAREVLGARALLDNPPDFHALRWSIVEYLAEQGKVYGYKQHRRSANGSYARSFYGYVLRKAGVRHADA